MTYVEQNRKDNKGNSTYRSKFYGHERLVEGRGSEINAPRIEPLYMDSRELFIPQLVDKVRADIIRMDVEVSRFVGFYRTSEKREMFENVSEGGNEVKDSLLHRVVRLGHRWEEVVDRGPDERNNQVQGVDLYRVWTGEV